MHASQQWQRPTAIAQTNTQQAKVGLHEFLLDACLLDTNIISGSLRQPSSLVNLQSEMLQDREIEQSEYS